MKLSTRFNKMIAVATELKRLQAKFNKLVDPIHLWSWEDPIYPKLRKHIVEVTDERRELDLEINDAKEGVINDYTIPEFIRWRDILKSIGE